MQCTSHVCDLRDIRKAKNNVDSLIVYYSKTFSKVEKNYSFLDYKCLAIIISIKHFYL